jgi:hypothetical protein
MLDVQGNDQLKAGNNMSTTIIRSVGVAAATMLAVGSAALLATPAQAKGVDDGKVEVRGTCSQGGTYKLKAKHDDNKIEWEFEVDTNKAGQTFAVTVKDNSRTVFSGSRTTLAPSGSFSVEKKTANFAGTDIIVARATRGSNVCAATVSV